MDEQYVYVDSRLRSSTEESNSYTLYLNTPIYSITRVDFVSACIPTTLSQNTMSTSDPYVFLDIEQFRSKYGVQACRSNLNSNVDTSATLYGYSGHIFYGDASSNKINSTMSNVVPTATGNTVTLYTFSNVVPYINYTEQQYKSSVTFQQPIESVSRLNIRWVDRYNNPVVFNPLNSDHSFMLRVYTTRKRIENYDQLKRPDPVDREKTYTDIRLYLILATLILGVFTIIMLKNNTIQPEV